MMSSVRFQGVYRIYAPTRERMLDKANELDTPTTIGVLGEQRVNYTNPKRNNLVLDGVVGRLLTDDDAKRVLADMGVPIADGESKESVDNRVGEMFASWSASGKYYERADAYNRAIAAYTLYQEALDSSRVQELYVSKRKPKTDTKA